MPIVQFHSCSEAGELPTHSLRGRETGGLPTQDQLAWSAEAQRQKQNERLCLRDNVDGENQLLEVVL